MRRFRAPAADRGVLQLPTLEELAAKPQRPGGDWPTRLQSFRAAARRELLPHDPDAVWIVTGHQPELSHPGVWAKNFAAAGLARRANGYVLNLIVDSDTVKNASVRVPGRNATGRVDLVNVPWDQVREEPYENRLLI
ncbi:MAG: hypothetical protein ACRCZF_08475, partial [Gemmataceae bacterium]